MRTKVLFFYIFATSSRTHCAVVAYPQWSADPSLGNSDLEHTFTAICCYKLIQFTMSMIFYHCQRKGSTVLLQPSVGRFILSSSILKLWRKSFLLGFESLSEDVLLHTRSCCLILSATVACRRWNHSPVVQG